MIKARSVRQKAEAGSAEHRVPEDQKLAESDREACKAAGMQTRTRPQSAQENRRMRARWNEQLEPGGVGRKCRFPPDSGATKDRRSRRSPGTGSRSA